MALTPVYSLPYQSLTDAPNGPTLGAELALAVEAELARIDAENRALELLNLSTGQAGSAGSATTTGGYVNFSSALTFIKRAGTDTNLRVFLAVDWFSTAVDTVGTFAVQIGGVDYEVFKKRATSANSYVQGVGVAHITGLAAGSYGVQPRMGRSSGAGTVTVDATNSFYSLDVMEVRSSPP